MLAYTRLRSRVRGTARRDRDDSSFLPRRFPFFPNAHLFPLAVPVSPGKPFLFRARQNKKGVVPPKDGFMDLDAHPTTTPEIRSLCADLGVLGRADFKNLLKWRLAVRKSRKLDGKRKAALRGGLSAVNPQDEKGIEVYEDDGVHETDVEAKRGAESDSDEKLMAEMSELRRGVDSRARREKKKKAKLRAKERVRTALGLVGQDEEGATGASEMDLFSLARIKSKGGLDAVQKAAAPGLDASRDSDDDLEDFEKRKSGARGKYDDSTDEDDDDAVADGRASDARLEAELDVMWREYKARHTKKGVTFAEKRGGRDSRIALGAGEIGSGSDEEDQEEIDQAAAAMKRAGERALALAVQEAAPSNPLLFDPSDPAGAAAGAKRGPAAARDWFANDLFGQAVPEVGSKTQAKSEAKAARRKAADAEAARLAAKDEGDSESGFDEDDDYFLGAGDHKSDDADDESEEDDAKRTKREPFTRAAKGTVTPLPTKKRARVGGDVGTGAGADSDEEDYDVLRAASAAKKEKDDAKTLRSEAKAAAKEAARASALKKQKKSPGGKTLAGYDDTYDDDTDSSEDDGGIGLTGSDPTGIKDSRARKGKENAGFLEAPAEFEARADSSDSDSEASDPDDLSDNEKAEILAIGKNMIRKKDRVRASVGFSFLVSDFQPDDFSRVFFFFF
jgi:AdoMet-dependent rRNA methyltransferase SPB1